LGREKKKRGVTKKPAEKKKAKALFSNKPSRQGRDEESADHTKKPHPGEPKGGDHASLGKTGLFLTTPGGRKKTGAVLLKVRQLEGCGTKKKKADFSHDIEKRIQEGKVRPQTNNPGKEKKKVWRVGKPGRWKKKEEGTLLTPKKKQSEEKGENLFPRTRTSCWQRKRVKTFYKTRRPQSGVKKSSWGWAELGREGTKFQTNNDFWANGGNPRGESRERIRLPSRGFCWDSRPPARPSGKTYEKKTKTGPAF